jgi:hypothetical protein
MKAQDRLLYCDKKHSWISSTSIRAFYHYYRSWTGHMGRPHPASTSMEDEDVFVPPRQPREATTFKPPSTGVNGEGLSSLPPPRGWPLLTGEATSTGLLPRWGFRQSTDTTSVWRPTCTVKTLGPHFITAYKPWYSWANRGLFPSLRRDT